MMPRSSKEDLKSSALLPTAVRAWITARPEVARVLANIGWLAVDKLIRLGTGVFVGIWLARYLGPERFGTLSLALALVALAASFSGMGMNGVIVRDLVRSPESARNTLATGFVVQLVGAILAYGVIGAGSALLKWSNNEVDALVLILGASLVFRVSDVAKYWFEANLHSRYSVWVENLALLLCAGVRIPLILVGAELASIAWVGVLEAALSSLGLLIMFRRCGFRAHFRDASVARGINLFRDAWPLLLSSLTVMLYVRLDTLMLDSMSGSHEVGVYSAATRISEVLYLLPTVLVSSLAPALIRSHKTNPAAYARRMKQLYCALAWAAILLVFPVALFADRLVVLLYGTEYSSAGPVLAIHLWASVAVFIGVASSQHLVLEGLQGLSFWRTTIGLAGNAILNFALIPSMGAKGAAIATVVSYFIATYSLVLFGNTREHALSMMLAPLTGPVDLLRKRLLPK